MLLPSSARETIHYYHLGEKTLTPELSRNAMLVFLLFLLTYMLGAILGVLHGAEPLDAVLESISCTSNCGISSGIVAPGISPVLKTCYLVQMLAGRLEFVTLLATVTSIAVSAARGVGDSSVGRAVVGAVPQSVRRAWGGWKGGQQR